jgi:hypothetical protein
LAEKIEVQGQNQTAGHLMWTTPYNDKLLNISKNIKSVTQVEGKPWTIKVVTEEKSFEISMVLSDGGERVTKKDEPAAVDKTTGGIDFRALPIAVQPRIADFVKELGAMPTPEIADLNAEWERIEKVLQLSASPSLDRLKEYIAVCYKRGELKGRAQDILVCVSGIIRQEEQESRQTEQELKDMLALLSL